MQLCIQNLQKKKSQIAQNRQKAKESADLDVAL